MQIRALLLFAAFLFTFSLSAQLLRTGYESAGGELIPDENVDVSPTVEALQSTLYELSSERHAAHQLHWNVTGPLFISLHELYEDIYTTLAAKIDEVAERKLALDVPADARPEAVAANADLKEVPKGFVTDLESLELLARRHLTISNRLAERIETTGDTDVVTQDLLISVKALIDKQLWMLRSHLK